MFAWDYTCALNCLNGRSYYYSTVCNNWKICDSCEKMVVKRKGWGDQDFAFHLKLVNALNFELSMIKPIPNPMLLYP